MDPYSDDLYQETLMVPRDPPHRDDIFREFLTLEDRRRNLARHSSLGNPLKKEFRKDKNIACSQKPSLIQGKAGIDREWIKHTTLELEKAALLQTDKYCLQMINDRLLAAKKKISDLDPAVLSAARQQGNPFEKVNCSIFMNRAAVKLASLDSMFNLVDTTRKSPLVYADLCGGPGGFTEYLQWKTRESRMACKGFGITLKGNQDFDMYSFKAIKASSMDFKTHYGVDGTGNLYNIENSKSFAGLVLKDTGNTGVDLVVADGGFSVKGDEAHQESHSKLIFVAQIITMLRVLKKGGKFVLKIFDLFTDFSVDLVHLLYLHFEKISICKPYSSRPANSERYIVCLNLHESQPKELIDFLEIVQKTLQSLRPSDIAATSAHIKHQPGFIPIREKIDLELLDLNRILDQSFVAECEPFVNAIEGSNMKLATKQKDALEDLFLYATVPTTLPYDQESIAKQCCREWKIPFV